jgi:hypothetical protein
LQPKASTSKFVSNLACAGAATSGDSKARVLKVDVGDNGLFSDQDLSVSLMVGPSFAPLGGGGVPVQPRGS